MPWLTLKTFKAVRLIPKPKKPISNCFQKKKTFVAGHRFMEDLYNIKPV